MPCKKRFLVENYEEGRDKLLTGGYSFTLQLYTKYLTLNKILFYTTIVLLIYKLSFFDHYKVNTVLALYNFLYGVSIWHTYYAIKKNGRCYKQCITSYFDNMQKMHTVNT